MDDFSTGHSSVSYLERLRLNQLKIDQPPLHDILNNAIDAAIAKTILVLPKGIASACDYLTTRSRNLRKRFDENFMAAYWVNTGQSN